MQCPAQIVFAAPPQIWSHVTLQQNGSCSQTAKQQDSSSAIVDQRIRQRLADCPYAFQFSRIAWRYDDGRLVLTGRLPTFYMKQVLQTMLRDIDGVDQVVNEVDVVCSHGLSSVRKDECER